MHHWTDEEKAKVAALLKRRLTAGQISRQVGRTRSAVISVVNRHNELRSIGFVHMQARANAQAR